MKPILLCLLIINASAFLVILSDKARARKNKWRIPEATLLTLALLGGSLGTLAGMYILHHKTRKAKFSLGVPCILLLQLLLGCYLFQIIK